LQVQNQQERKHAFFVRFAYFCCFNRRLAALFYFYYLFSHSFILFKLSHSFLITKKKEKKEYIYALTMTAIEGIAWTVYGVIAVVKCLIPPFPFYLF
jgi:hypothetical protein